LVVPGVLGLLLDGGRIDDLAYGGEPLSRSNKTGTGTSRHLVSAWLSFDGSEPVPVLLEPVRHLRIDRRSAGSILKAVGEGSLRTRATGLFKS
jgi:hypothetical protein